MSSATTETPADSFREFKAVRQEPRGHRRWFEASDIELVVWHDDHGRHAGFQLLYQQEHEERALTWLPATGFAHSRVDSGDELTKKQSPILIPDGAVPWEFIVDRFQRHAGSLEPDLRDFVLTRLRARH